MYADSAFKQLYVLTYLVVLGGFSLFQHQPYPWFDTTSCDTLTLSYCNKNTHWTTFICTVTPVLKDQTFLAGLIFQCS